MAVSQGGAGGLASFGAGMLGSAVGQGMSGQSTSDSCTKSTSSGEKIWTDEQILVYERGSEPRWMDAGIDTVSRWNPESIRINRELLGTGFSDGLGRITAPFSTVGGSESGTPIQTMPMGYSKKAFYWHYHAAYAVDTDEFFTYSDLIVGQKQGVACFLGTPSSTVKLYIPPNYHGQIPLNADYGKVYRIIDIPYSRN